MISLPLWFQLYYYMISNKWFVISFEEDLKRITRPSGDLKQNGDSDENIKCSNTDENNQHVDTESPQETSDATHPVSQGSDDSKPVDSSVVTEAPTDEPSFEQEPTETPEETRDGTDPYSNQSFKASRSKSDKLIGLDIKNTHSTPEFVYSKNGNIVTYTAKEGYGFCTVIKGKAWWECGSEEVIWESRFRSQYLNKVVIETGTNEEKTLTIHCVDGTTAVAKKVKDGNFVVQNEQTSDDPKPADSSAVGESPTSEPCSEQDGETPEQTKDSADPVSQSSEHSSHKIDNLIDLDIKKTDSTAEFDYSSEGKVTTYTAKQGYGFGTIKKGKSGWNCTGSDEIIWETKDKTQASNKVRLTKGCDGTNTTLCILEIYIVDGSTLRYFNSDSVNSPYYKKWVQKFEDVSKDLHPQQIKIYTKDETKDKPVENDASKYKVNIFNEGKSSKYFYYIKKDVKCTQVKYNNNEVWNDTENKDYKNFDRLTYDTGDNSIVLEYKGTAFKKYKIPNEPRQK